MRYGSMKDNMGETMEHSQITSECREIFKRVDEKLDALIGRADKINGRYDKHMDEGVSFRAMVMQHEEKLKSHDTIRTELRVWALSSIIVFISGCVWIGGKMASLDRLETLHPIGKVLVEDAHAGTR